MAATASRADASTALKFFAVNAATFSSRGECRACRKSFMKAPVSMPTGHASLQVESPAHVSTASYPYASTSASSTGEPDGWRIISRRSTIRWRGVVVRSSLGHVGSQKPHSMHGSAISSTLGIVLRPRRWALGSRSRTMRGARTPSGSMTCLVRHINSVAFAPHSSSRNGAMLRPVACSALSEPSKRSTVRRQNSSMNAAYRSTSSGLPASKASRKCRLPCAA